MVGEFSGVDTGLGVGSGLEPSGADATSGGTGVGKTVNDDGGNGGTLLGGGKEVSVGTVTTSAGVVGPQTGGIKSSVSSAFGLGGDDSLAGEALHSGVTLEAVGGAHGGGG